MTALRRCGVPDQLISTANHDLKRVWLTHQKQQNTIKKRAQESDFDFCKLL